MQASETKLRQLVEGTKQYVVPLFQRPYSWSEKQWKTLWIDVRDKASHTDGRPHFFGSIVVTQAKSVPHGVGKYLLIDGQQRLTTVEILLAAIRDSAESLEHIRLRDRIEEQYLTNKHEEGDERLKILPTQDDSPAFRAIIQKQELPSGRLRDCYEFFRSQLRRSSPEQLDHLHLAAVDRLSLVSITCDEYDNPHLIFESLNAKGEKLTPADLIRNFLLMQVHVNDQDRLFRTHWLPIQQALRENLTEFVRHYLMKSGKILQTADIYFELKDRLTNTTPAQAEEFLADLHRHGMFYASFVDPQRAGESEIGDRLERLGRLKVTVAYPLLLRIFDAHESGLLTSQQVIAALDTLESFVIRRAICNVPTNQLRRIFPPVFEACGGAGPDFVDRLRKQLGGQRCPDDDSFANSLKTVPLYATGEKTSRLRLILESIERSFAHKEPADLSKATIEHILPQTLTAEWSREFGDDDPETYQRLLHTLGNLTLSAYNSELSNQTYAVKRKLLFLESHIVLNQHFQNVDRWTEAEITARANVLAQIALKVWPDVGRESRPTEQATVPTRPPAAVRFRGEVQPCKNWRDGFVKLVEALEVNAPGLFASLVNDPALSAILSTDPSRFGLSKLQLGNVFVNTHGSASALRKRFEKLALHGDLQTQDYEFIVASE